MDREVLGGFEHLMSADKPGEPTTTLLTSYLSSVSDVCLPCDPVPQANSVPRLAQADADR